MINKKTNRIMAMALALPLLAALAGCSGAGKNAAKLDSLYEQETGRLFNGSDRQRKGLPGVEDDDLAKDSHSLEAQGDNMAMNGDFEGALFVYNRAVLVAEKKQRMRLLGKAGELTLRQGRYAETRGIMEKLTKDDPTNANAWLDHGACLFEHEREAPRPRRPWKRPWPSTQTCGNRTTRLASSTTTASSPTRR